MTANPPFTIGRIRRVGFTPRSARAALHAPTSSVERIMDRAQKAIMAQRGFAARRDDAAHGSLGASALACAGCLLGVVLLLLGAG